MSHVSRYFGAPNSEARTAFFDALRAQIAESSPFSVTVVLRSASLKPEVRAQLSGVFPNLVTISEWLHEMSGKTPLPISRQLVIFHSLVQQKWPELFSQNSPAFSRGVVEQLFALFRQLPDYNLTPEDLALPQFRTIPGFAVLPDLFKAFRHALDQSGGDDFTQLGQIVAQPEALGLADTHVFWLGFAELPVYWRRLARLAMTQCKSSTWHLSYAEKAVNSGLSQALFDWLSPQVTTDHGPFPELSIAKDAGYYLQHFTSIQHEITATLRHIRHRIYLENQSPSEIGILIPKADPYTDLLIARCAEAAIPITLHSSELLKKRHLYGTIMATIDLLTQPWDIDTIIQFCHTPFVSFFRFGNGPACVIDGPVLAHLNRHLPPAQTAEEWFENAELVARQATNSELRDNWIKTVHCVRSIHAWVLAMTEVHRPSQFGLVLAAMMSAIGVTVDDAIQAAVAALESGTTLMPKRWEDAGTTLKLVIDSIRLSTESDTESGVLITTPENSIGVNRRFWWVCGFQEGNWPVAIPEHWLIPARVQQMVFPDRDPAILGRYALWSILSQPETRIQMSVAPERANTACITARIGEGLEIHKQEGALAELASVRELGTREIGVAPVPPVIGEAGLLAALRQQIPNFSPTALDTIADCRHRFFFRSVLRIVPDIEREREIETIQWGNFIHELIAAVLEELMAHPDSRDVHRIVAKIAKEKWADLRETHPLWHLKKSQLFGDPADPSFAIISLIASYLSDMLDEWQPIKSEWKFTWKAGPDSPDIIGTVDAIFQHRQLNYFAILDFKTGKSVPDRGDIAQYKRFQLPIYALAVQAEFPNLQMGPVGYLHLHNAAKSGFHIRLTSDSAKQNKVTIGRSQPLIADGPFWAGFHDKIKELMALVLAGDFDFPPAPDQPQICEYCAYIRICRAPNRYRGEIV